MTGRRGYAASVIVMTLFTMLLAGTGASQLAHRDVLVSWQRESSRHRADQLARAAIAEAMFQVQTWVNSPEEPLPGADLAPVTTWFQLVRIPPADRANGWSSAGSVAVPVPEAAQLARAESLAIPAVEVRLVRLVAPGGLVQGVLSGRVTVRGAGLNRRLTEHRRFHHLVISGERVAGDDPAGAGWAYTRCHIDGRPLGRFHESL